MEGFKVPPALYEEEMPHLDAVAATEKAIERRFFHEERLRAAELRFNNAQGLITLLEGVIQTEYDNLCTDSQGEMLPEVKVTLDNIQAEIQKHREIRRKKEQGYDVESPETKKEIIVKKEESNKLAILEIDSTM